MTKYPKNTLELHIWKGGERGEPEGGLRGCLSTVFQKNGASKRSKKIKNKNGLLISGDSLTGYKHMMLLENIGELCRIWDLYRLLSKIETFTFSFVLLVR